MGVLGCNLLRGDALARCAELVEALTSGECGGCALSGSVESGRVVADFFERPMVMPFQEHLHSRKLLKCTQGCRSGAICTECVACAMGQRSLLHCKKCLRACCLRCCGDGRGLGPVGACAGEEWECCPHQSTYGFFLCSDCHPLVMCARGGCGFRGSCSACMSKIMCACSGCGGTKCGGCFADDAESERYKEGGFRVFPLPAACTACKRVLCNECRGAEEWPAFRREQCDRCFKNWCRRCIGDGSVLMSECTRRTGCAEKPRSVCATCVEKFFQDGFVCYLCQ